MTPTIDVDYVHKFVPAHPNSAHVTLMLLHGTGGDENWLLSLGNQLCPGAALLGLRGKVLENGMRLATGRLLESRLTPERKPSR